MKKIISLIIIALLFVACESVTENIPEEETNNSIPFKASLPSVLEKGETYSIKMEYDSDKSNYSAFILDSKAGVGIIDVDDLYYLALKAGKDKVVIQVRDENTREFYEDTLSVVITDTSYSDPQYIILKADDVMKGEDGYLLPRWLKYIDFCNDNNIASSLGIIANSLEEKNTPYIETLKDVAKNPLFEIWNHGYDHFMYRKYEDGSVYHEFYNYPYEDQLEHFNKAQDLVKDRLGVTMVSFGSCGNAYDKSTHEIFDANPDMKIWFYGSKWSNKFTLKRKIEIEQTTGVPDYNTFTEIYDRAEDVYTLQVHPNMWEESNFNEFTKIISFLKERKVTFITAKDYYELVNRG